MSSETVSPNVICTRAAATLLRTRATAALLAIVLASTSACFAPVSVKRIDPETAYRDLRENTLSNGRISNASRNTLRRYDLLALYQDDPAGGIAQLRELTLRSKPTKEQLATLGETSFEHAMASGDDAYFRAAVLYAYALLFPDNPNDALDPTDPGVRIALDLYNSALVRGFIAADGRRVTLASGEYRLPFGTLHVTFDEQTTLWSNSQLVDFIPATEIGVTGLRNRYRHWGIGAALAARAEYREDVNDDDVDDVDHVEMETDYVPRNSRISVTALLRLDDASKQLVTDSITATLELHTPTDPETVEINGYRIPLEAEPTAALAVTLAETQPWRREIRRFMGAVLSANDTDVRLGALNPPRPDRIPVIFVHGTNSSSARWANMVNDLLADKTIRDRFEFYFFAYDSGNPIAYSGMQLREELDGLHATLERKGVGDCVDHMVIIGHSQGGLLTKLTITDSGNTMWNTVSEKPFERVKISSRNRDLVRRALFFEARPYIDRAVFIATPHHGSYLAGSNFARRIAQWMVAIPAEMASLSADLLQLREDRDVYLEGERPATSIDNMSPGSRAIKAMAKLKIHERVTTHSIIAVSEMGPLEEARDGVVTYTSAHIDGVESELVVKSGHSTQDNPHTINEVQRILQIHAAATACGVHGGFKEMRLGF